jgi:hypothetical protein
VPPADFADGSAKPLIFRGLPGSWAMGINKVIHSSATPKANDFGIKHLPEFSIELA